MNISRHPALLLFSTCTLLLAAAFTGCVNTGPEAAAGPLALRSPDGRIVVEVSAVGALTYRVLVDGVPVLKESRLGLRLHDGTELGREVEPGKVARTESDSTWANPLGKNRDVRNHYREMRLALREKSAGGRAFTVTFRAFDDGVGFRYSLPATAPAKEFVLDEELTEFAFTGDQTCFAGEQEKKGFAGSQEWEFRRMPLSEVPADTVVGLPVLVHTSAAWVALAEADLTDWSGMWLSRAAKPAGQGVTLRAKLAPRLDGEGLVKAVLPHDSPWRVLIIGREPGRLIESNLVLNLSPSSQIADPSWIKPGLMAWDHWWSGGTIMDTATIESYIQLAADMHWPYQLIDWQWYGKPAQPDSDITRVNPALDLAEVRRFAAEHGVRLWVWLHWTDVDRNDAYQKAFALYEQWGIAGVKIDFMDRDDQVMVDWYEKITRAAAAHHLMVNFHGAFKPTGMNRTWPNQITREGVLGNEYNKWSTRVTPEHKVTLPFTRYLVGPGDFTPGGFLNRTPAQFQTNVSPTQVQGTRAAQLALFVIYDSPIGCVCENPDYLRGQPGADFLRQVPTVWDETRVLSGAVAEQIVVARRAGADWYLGALTNSNPRRLPVKLDFLGRGRWNLRWWHDAADSAEKAEHLEFEERDVTAADTLDFNLAPAGGAVARLVREP
jgi:alpha-glucosidase